LADIFKLNENSLVISSRFGTWDLYFNKDDYGYTFRIYRYGENEDNSYSSYNFCYISSLYPAYSILNDFYTELNNGQDRKINIYSDDKPAHDFDKANSLSIVKKPGTYTSNFCIETNIKNYVFIDSARRKDNKGYFGKYDKDQLLAIEKLFIELSKIAEEPYDINNYYNFNSDYEPDAYDKLYEKHRQSINNIDLYFPTYSKPKEEEDQFCHQLRLVKRNIKK
jgi:hypothetical protein